MGVSLNYFSPPVNKMFTERYRAPMATDAVQTAETRGRPRIRDDDEILRAALRAFAEHGYEGMSLRTLNAEMGLSRGTINQRFGSKEQLWYAAVDHEFRCLIDDLNVELQQRAVADDDLSRVREGIRAFLIASVRRPELVRLMNQEGLHSTSRLDHIMTSFTLPTLRPVWQAVNRLADAGVVRRVPARTLLFLIAHGAAAPFTLGPLSDRFDAVDGPLDPVDHIELATDIIVSGLRTAEPC
jgi:AcrR family transcriptional regulator